MQQPAMSSSLNPADLADIKPLHEAAIPWTDVVLIAGVCAAVLCLLALIIWRFKRTSRPVEAALPAAQVHWGVVLKDRLNALPRAAPAALEESRRVYFELTSVCRELLERTLGLPITERTVQEILELVKGRISAEDERQIRAFWLRSEALLFAKVPFASEDYTRDLSFARDLLTRALRRESGSDGSGPEQNSAEGRASPNVLREAP